MKLYILIVRTFENKEGKYILVLIVLCYLFLCSFKEDILLAKHWSGVNDISKELITIYMKTE